VFLIFETCIRIPRQSYEKGALKQKVDEAHSFEVDVPLSKF